MINERWHLFPICIKNITEKQRNTPELCSSSNASTYINIDRFDCVYMNIGS